MEKELYEAARDGMVAELAEIPRDNPTLNVNWQDVFGYTPLRAACDSGHDAIVSILLAHPNIDVNLADEDGWTPFFGACRKDGPPVFVCC